MPLDPDTRKYLDAIAQAGRPTYDQLTPAEGRKLNRETTPLVTPDPKPMQEVRDLGVPGPGGQIPVRLYYPQGAAGPLPLLIYFHGGGWILGDLDTHDSLCRQLAAGSSCAVLAVDYRMGPEHPFPAAVDDAWAALVWVTRKARTLGLDPSRIVVSGDSAGGNLAAVMAIRARDERGPALAAQLLIYPATDLVTVRPSRVRNGQGYLLTEEVIRYFHDNYVDVASRADWRASPLLARDLGRLPPAFVMTAEYDPLLDEGVAYAERLRASGVPVAQTTYAGMIHGFFRLGRVIPSARSAVEDACAFLRKGFLARAPYELIEAKLCHPS